MEGKTVLFVGTKKQAQESVELEAKRCGMYYVSQRWLGGMLTNYKTMRSRVRRLEKIERMEESGEFELLPKKEVIKLRHEYAKLNRNLGGIRDMKELAVGIKRYIKPFFIPERYLLPKFRKSRIQGISMR